MVLNRKSEQKLIYIYYQVYIYLRNTRLRFCAKFSFT